MKKMKMKLASLILLISIGSQSNAEVGEVNFKGLIQTWYSVAQQDTISAGYTLRRVRFKPYGKLSENVTWYCQYGWDKQSLWLADAAMDIKFSKMVNMKVGKFAVPAAKSAALTSSGKLDLIERSMIVQKWGGNTALNGYRTQGVQLHGKVNGGEI